MAVRAAENIGPFRGDDGNPWDDGTRYTGVRGISLTYREAVGFFRAVYDKNGVPVQGPEHPSGDSSYHPVNIYFNFPKETITKVSGYIAENIPAVRSITVTTNKNIYGPFGVEKGKFFSHDIPDGVFISGFFGTSNVDYLNKIECHKIVP